MAAANTVLYREVQGYRQVPPFLLIGAVSILAGWGLLAWSVFLDRPLGALTLPDWLVWLIWAALGVGLPILLFRLEMVTEVHPDRIVVRSGTSKYDFFLRDIVRLTARTEAALSDYSNRDIGPSGSRVAYTVLGNLGVEMELRDGRTVLIGSQEPEELAAAIAAARERLAA